MAVWWAGLCRVSVLLSVAGTMKEPGRLDCDTGNCGLRNPVWSGWMWWDAGQLQGGALRHAAQQMMVGNKELIFGGIKLG